MALRVPPLESCEALITRYSASSEAKKRTAGTVALIRSWETALRSDVGRWYPQIDVFFPLTTVLENAFQIVTEQVVLDDAQWCRCHISPSHYGAVAKRKDLNDVGEGHWQSIGQQPSNPRERQQGRLEKKQILLKKCLVDRSLPLPRAICHSTD